MLPHVLILLPPSEGKAAPAEGLPVDLDSLSFPELTAERIDLLGVLVRLCRKEPAAAAVALALGPRQAEEVERNAMLPQAPAAPARHVYTGVLYEAMGLRHLTGPAAVRADSWLAVTSALWGLLRPSDRIPAYRLGGGVNLPGVGPIASYWRTPLRKTIPAVVGEDFVVDLRSTTYAAFWKPDAQTMARTATVRILHEHAGRRTVVSHHNKATKSRVVHQLLDHGDEPASAADLADLLRTLGWTVELSPGGPRTPATLDVIVSEVAAK